MNHLKLYPRALTVIALALVVTAGLVLGGYVDPAAAAAGVLLADAGPVDLKTLEAAVKKAFDAMAENVKKVQDTADKALEEVRKEGTLHEKTNKSLTELGEVGNKLAGDFKSLKDDFAFRLLEVEQKLAKKPGGGGDVEKSAGQLVIESPEYQAMLKSGEFKMNKVAIQRKVIANATGQNQPLVPVQRVPGIIAPATRRLTVRDLLPQLPASSNLIEFCRELVYTNNAGPQYDTTSPTPHAEGAPKNESNITFELATAAVTTLAHWVGASRQVLKDAPGLQAYIDTRLGYGLKLEEEDELLNGTGSNGQLSGLITNATAFTGGQTNQKRLDTLLRAFLQVSLSEYEASGVVMHPGDWTEIMLAKDTNNNYLFSNPHNMEVLRVWGKPVVPTQSITLGTWLTGAFDLAAAIYDSEDMSIRVSDSHSDFFTKNLVAILCEERLALAIYRPTAIVTGSFNFAG